MSQNPQDRQSYPLRLPNYRSLHQERYHPYPTFNRQQGGTSQEVGDVEAMDPITLADEAGPSVQQEPPTQTQQAANEPVDTDLANLVVVVDELQGSRAGDATSRDYAFASEMQRRPATTKSETNRRS